jgi:DNA-binding Lrp family transcriptional regulator
MTAELTSKRRSAERVAFGQCSPLLDEVNLGLLRELQVDPRQPTAKLARTLGMSALAVSERIQRLREGGVITGCRLDVDSPCPRLACHRLRAPGFPFNNA